MEACCPPEGWYRSIVCFVSIWIYKLIEASAVLAILSIIGGHVLSAVDW